MEIDVIDIGPVLHPPMDTRSHIEMRVGGKVEFVPRAEAEEMSEMVSLFSSALCALFCQWQ